ncbi:Ferredoxin--NADP reductase [Alphaproteobacteria bacterium]
MTKLDRHWQTCGKTHMKQYCTDIAIVGSGPAGLFSAFEAGMLGFKSTIIDCLPDIGGQCAALYPEKPIYDIPGHPVIRGHELIENLYRQIQPFNPNILLQNKVTAIRRTENKNGAHECSSTWELVTDNGITVTAGCVIIAIGGGACTPKKPPLGNLELFEGVSVFYSVKDVQQFENKTVVVAGGGDSAVDWVIHLANIAKKIYLIHRREHFRAAPGSVAKLKELALSNRIEIVTPYQLHGFTGDKNGNIHTVELIDVSGNVKFLETDVLLSFFGLSMDNSSIAEWGLDLSSDLRHIVVNPATMETNLNGIFAVGDISWYSGKLKLILTGFAEAALACHSAYNILRPGQPLHFQYSTTKKVPNLRSTPVNE